MVNIGTGVESLAAITVSSLPTGAALRGACGL
jgi:hypothetical protein